MVTLPPEYAITKLGMSHSLPRKRDKPLRTYGKRSAPAPESPIEPPSKRLHLTAEAPPSRATLQSQGGPEPGARLEAAAGGGPKEQENRTSPRPGGERPAQHPSILSYFKPIALASDSSPERELQQESTERRSRSQRPPGSLLERRKPRLLKLRATSSSPHYDIEEVVNGAGAGKAPRRGGESNTDLSVLEDRRRAVLPDTDPDQEDDGADGAQVGSDVKPRQRPRVQTTLNISTRAAFQECRVCDTVWNPLYPDDVKYHARRHAKVARARTKKATDL